MTWKLRILNVQKKPNDRLNIYVYFVLYRLDGNRTEEYHKDEYKISEKDITENTGSVQTIEKRKKFIKDFIKNRIKPLTNVSESLDGLETLIGHEEIL